MTTPTSAPEAEIGIFGGSGLYSLLGGDILETIPETPYGPVSDVVTIGTIAGRRVAFLPRHGRNHQHPPHRIPYRANLWAMRQLGVTQILAPCAVGSLQPEVEPGTFVLCDQLVDWTRGRPSTFYDGPITRHVNFAEPYDPWMRQAVLLAAKKAGIDVHDRGTMAVVEGPRFSTAAESRILSRLGCTVINMTGHPEAALARELAIGYASIALVTDYDAGLKDDPSVPAVTQDVVAQVFAENLDRLRQLLFTVVPELPSIPSPVSTRALDDATFG